MASHSRHALHQLRDLINRDPDRFAANVYTRMFAINPGLRDLFPAMMANQRDAFFRVVDHVLEVVPAESGHSELVEFLAQLGRDHRKFGVLPEHYSVMYQALVAEFAAVMGPYWDPEAQEAVTQAMMLTTGVMRGAAETAPMPALWRAEVVEKFRITRDLAVVRLISQAPLRFTAGQYLEVQIPQRPRAWRNLSPAIPSNPAGEMEFHVRAVHGGAVSAAIVGETRPGDVWFFSQVHGTLHVVPEFPVLMVAGGTGLAPLRAMVIEMSKRADNPPTHLYYGMRYPGELYDVPVLRRIAATNPWLSVTVVAEEVSDPWWIETGVDPATTGLDYRIGRVGDVVAGDGPWDEHQVLIAGSAEMIEATRLRLIIAGARASRIQHDPVH